MKTFILFYLTIGLIRTYIDRNIVEQVIDEISNDVEVRVLPDKLKQIWYILTLIFAILFQTVTWPHRVYSVGIEYVKFGFRNLKADMEYLKGLYKYKKDYKLTWIQVIKDLKKARKEK